MFSSTRNMINIEISKGQCLRLEYDFNLSKEELELLLAREDCPEWGTDAYDSKNLLHTNSDWIGENRCPKAAKGLYAASISNITDETESIHLLFRRSALNPDMPLLYLVNRENRETLELTYEKVMSADKILFESKRQTRKKFFFDLVKILILVLIIILLYQFYPKRGIIYPLLFTAALLCYRFWNLMCGYRKFFSMIERLHCFKEQNGQVISVKK